MHLKKPFYLLLLLFVSSCGETLYGDLVVNSPCSEKLTTPPASIEVAIASNLENKAQNDYCEGNQTVELKLQQDGTYKGFYKIVVSHWPGFDSFQWTGLKLDLTCTALGCEGESPCELEANQPPTPYIRGGTERDVSVACSCK